MQPRTGVVTHKVARLLTPVGFSACHPCSSTVPSPLWLAALRDNVDRNRDGSPAKALTACVSTHTTATPDTRRPWDAVIKGVRVSHSISMLGTERLPGPSLIEDSRYFHHTPPLPAWQSVSAKASPYLLRAVFHMNPAPPFPRSRRSFPILPTTRPDLPTPPRQHTLPSKPTLAFWSCW
jgi:hypothetical protein